MFFHHLKNFSPYSGHIYDDMKVPLIRKKDRHFNKSPDRFDLMDRLGYFPFKEMIRDGRAYFISDLDLFAFLSMDGRTIENYVTDFIHDWDISKQDIFLKSFLNGYDAGIIEYERNLGASYQTLPQEQKTQYLHTFCLYCLDFLYFDGDLDEHLFYNLGYLQASLYRGFVDINNIESILAGRSIGIRLHFDSYLKVLGSAKTKEEIIPTILTEAETVNESSLPINTRIELLCDLEEVRTIWRVLTAPIKTKNGVQDAVFNVQELNQFLGSAFSSGAFPEAFKTGNEYVEKRTSKGDMRSILNALMYVTYQLNHEHNRSANLIEYASSLIQHFPVFSGSKPESVKSVLATHTPNGMKVLKDSQGVNPHVEEMISVLKKHRILH
ncbi:hypothetical protein [Pedobacter polysacchareus]|uniref:hypothetical protein n=1 Tax=Pedobacter polysacchareus TaxID=2861973 RepID=UPI001C9A0C64|nr:hypothetical protein [Pedobacter polysacchareus]